MRSPDAGVALGWKPCPAVNVGHAWWLAVALALPWTFACARSAAQSQAGPPSQKEIARGLELMQHGEAAEAKIEFDAAIKAAPRSADALTWRGICENQLQQYAAAAADFRYALRLQPTMLSAHYNLALSLIRLHETDAAIEELKVVIAAQPRAVQPLYNVAVLLESKGAFADAADKLDRAHTLDPGDKGVTLHLLFDSLRSDRMLAVPALVSDLRDGSTSPEMQGQAASALLRVGRFADAETLLRSARDHDPANGAYALALARVLLATDHADEARAVLSDLKDDGRSAEKHVLNGVALAATHAVAEAVPELRMAIAEDPSLALAHNLLGFCLFQQGQYAEAAEAYGRASDLEPDRPLYAHDAALASERAGREPQALHFAERSVSANGSNAGDHALLGKLYAKAGRNEVAVRELRRAAALDPDLDAAPYLLARTYMRMGDQQQATEWSNKLSSLKQRHEAAFALRKKEQSAPVRSSALLRGGSLQDDEAGGP